MQRRDVKEFVRGFFPELHRSREKSASNVQALFCAGLRALALKFCSWRVNRNLEKFRLKKGQRFGMVNG
jgi:hypothetical protein